MHFPKCLSINMGISFIYSLRSSMFLYIKNKNLRLDRETLKPSAVLLLILIYSTIPLTVQPNSNWCDSPFNFNCLELLKAVHRHKREVNFFLKLVKMRREQQSCFQTCKRTLETKFLLKTFQPKNVLLYLYVEKMRAFQFLLLLE